GHDDPGNLAEVLRGDLVVAAARGVGLDELPVAEHHDHEQQHDGAGHEGGEGEERHAAHEQDHQQLLRRVGDGAQRVGGEDGQCHALRQQLLVDLLGGERVAQEDAFGQLRGVRGLSAVIRHDRRHYACRRR
ncbi:hypothetical protein ABE10_00450, partial [Bacillus toyonensis]|nr:hypothetical protein [Bacillus toyonensis]